MAAAKWRILAFKAKLEIINNVDQGANKLDVAVEFNIPRSTLSTLLKSKAVIRAKAYKRTGARGTQYHSEWFSPLRSLHFQ